ncbi:MAG TPA: DUF5808 domain-containing protein [Terriglobia bacterium]|nr:DUF5808 domain-containing protein [Terriglobia bacterium]
MSVLLPITATFMIAVVLSAVFLCWLPRLTRPDLYFALTVPPTFRDGDDGRAILGRFRVQVLLYSLAACVLVIAGGWRSSMLLLASGIAVQVAGFFEAYLGARSRVRPHTQEPTPLREAPLAPRPASLPGGRLVRAGPVVLLALTALYLNRRWADIPARFPNHWGLDGQPNGWATRSLGGVYGPLAQAILICLMLLLLGYGLTRWSRPIRLRGAPGHAEEHFRRVVLGVLLATQYLLALVFIWAALLPLSPGPPSLLVGAGLPLAFTVVVFLVLIRQGQGGARRVEASALAGKDPRPVGDRTLDRYWKVGMFYVNPDDPALFVEKRFGIGYTVNFGRPATWVILGAVLLVALLGGLVAMLAHK